MLFLKILAKQLTFLGCCGLLRLNRIVRLCSVSLIFGVVYFTLYLEVLMIKKLYDLKESHGSISPQEIEEINKYLAKMTVNNLPVEQALLHKWQRIE